MGDGQCEKYVFDPYLKALMKKDGEEHDGYRRCYNKEFKDGVCKFHWNKKRKGVLKWKSWETLGR